jgi:hypothetical protein
MAAPIEDAEALLLFRFCVQRIYSKQAGLRRGISQLQIEHCTTTIPSIRLLLSLCKSKDRKEISRRVA